MLELIKTWLYEIITTSGIIWRLMPFIKPWIRRFLFTSSNSNFKIRDDEGNTLSVVKYNGKLFPVFRVDTIAGIKSVKIRKDDVLLCGYPKSGCHWVYEILYMLMTGKAEVNKYGKGIAGMLELVPHFIIDSHPSPRVLNSHVLYEELPHQIKERKTKIVLTVRCPKDTVVSYYNHVKALRHAYEYSGSFENFFKVFMAGKMEYGCYFDFVTDWGKVIKNQKDNQILVVEYEKLKVDPLGKIKEIAQFLNINITDRFAQEIQQATDFSNMKANVIKANRTDDQLFRKGQVGDWRNWLTEAQSTEIDQVWKDRMSNCFYQPEM